jgi:acetoacetyl-CoA synthetase
MPDVLWRPTPEQTAGANITKYTEWLKTRGRCFTDYEALWRWSVTDLESFWGSIWEYFDVDAATPYDRVLGRRTMPGAEWFPGATLSFPQHVFRNRDEADIVIRHASELRPLSAWSYGDLKSRTAAVAAGLRAAGVKPGDRVAAYIPNIPEAVAALLACASIGAIWSSCSPDFGVRSVIDRFAQIEPRVLLAVDGYRYGGKDYDRMDTLAELQCGLPSLETTVVLPYRAQRPDLSSLRGAALWNDFVRPGSELTCTPVPFDHPLWVLYSSGTTGLPKPIVQSHGGVLLEELMFLHLHCDCKAGDRFFWFTTTGWAMWNITISALLTPASIVLFDGSPACPDLGTLWNLVESAGITIFGTSAAYIGQCQKAGIRPREGRDLKGLRCIASTASPLPPEGFSWVYEEFGSDVWLYSMSGGTDIVGPLLAALPTVPVVAGELAVRVLGAAVDAWDETGKPVVGKVGELVVTEPIPSMPTYLWGDIDGHRYYESYFDMYPGIWRHGDWLEMTPRGSGIIHGRSDATINRGGVRMGTSEIYRSVLALDEVLDALVVDLSRPGGEGFMPLFVVLRPGVLLDEELTRRIAERIRSECSPRHVPDRIYPLAAIPRTLTGKILEVPIKRILLGEFPEHVTSRDSLANPEALDWFVANRLEVLSGSSAIRR